MIPVKLPAVHNLTITITSWTDTAGLSDFCIEPMAEPSKGTPLVDQHAALVEGGINSAPGVTWLHLPAPHRKHVGVGEKWRLQAAPSYVGGFDHVRNPPCACATRRRPILLSDPKGGAAYAAWRRRSREPRGINSGINKARKLNKATSSELIEVAKPKPFSGHLRRSAAAKQSIISLPKAYKMAEYVRSVRARTRAARLVPGGVSLFRWLV